MQSRAFDYSKYENWINPKDVIPYKKNIKKHSQEQIDDICKSISKYGWQADIVITSDKVVVIGHGRRLAAINLGCLVPYHEIDKKVDELTEDDIRELRITDNMTHSETGYDFSLLESESIGLNIDDWNFSLYINSGESRIEDTAKEYSEEDFGDESFKYECPCCGFRFNE